MQAVTFAFFFWVCCMGVCAAQPVALVVDRSGEVLIEAGGEGRPAVSLEPLSVAWRVKLVNSGRLTVLYLRTGHEFTVSAPSEVEVDPTALRRLSGVAPSVRVPKEGTEIVLRPARVEQGGITLRAVGTELPAPRISAEAIESRRPAPSAPWASRVAFALWLESIESTTLARQAWRELAAERPDDGAIASRAR